MVQKKKGVHEYYVDYKERMQKWTHIKDTKKPPSSKLLKNIFI